MRNLITILLLIGLTSNAIAQEQGDLSRGARLALTTCSTCHAVRRGQLRSPDPMAPNFTDVATTLGMTDRALRVWLQSSHPTMPNIVLTNSERDDVVAYIMSLRARD
jgi:mono/diheme cytochrome c family protein